MKPKLSDLYNRLKKNGITPEQDQRMRLELDYTGTHDLPEDNSPESDQNLRHRVREIYTLSTI